MRDPIWQPKVQSRGLFPPVPPLITASVYWDTQIGIAATFKSTISPDMYSDNKIDL